MHVFLQFRFFLGAPEPFLLLYYHSIRSQRRREIPRVHLSFFGFIITLFLHPNCILGASFSLLLIINRSSLDIIYFDTHLLCFSDTKEHLVLLEHFRKMHSCLSDSLRELYYYYYYFVCCLSPTSSYTATKMMCAHAFEKTERKYAKYAYTFQ